MRLVPVPASKLDCLLPLLVEAQKEFLHAVDPDLTLERIKLVYGANGLSAFVDTLDQPSHCLILQNMLGLFHPDLMTVVTLVFSTKSTRGESDFPESAIRTTESFAALNGATKIAGSSWVMGGHKGIDQMWLSSGFQLQEKIYVKSL